MDWSKPVKSLLNRIQKNGGSLVAIDDAGDCSLPPGSIHIPKDVSLYEQRRIATELITSIDMSRLLIEYNGKRSFLTIVLGNGPEEIMADWTISCPEIETFMEKIEEEHYNYWEGKS